MEKIWLAVIAASLFLLSIFLFWRITARFRKKEYSEKMWKLWGTRTFYWEGAIYISTGVTVLIMFILKWTHVLTF
ncbi:hypothetical protein [Mariniflexile sp. AS56]|uniref:hypothetical protein n=1 Tax=Mariniflexile sp. AS56 TaxID=3063957 RepID=UPI0026F2F7A2|nr:hypothetical protein [Mariniflexile sp. AS56]MDO7170596.1 hypothetical protein [Mariniflexile sp. AS56]